MLYEIADLAVAFADKRDHADVGRIVLRHRAKQRALTHSTASENPDPLTLPAGQKAIDRADAGDERFADRLAFERTGRRTEEGVDLVGADRTDRKSVV